MRPTDDPLIDIASAILEGRDIDWRAAESTITEADRSLISEFQVLSGLADFHRRPADAPPDPPRGVPWGPLQLIESVGRGRYGEVFRAWDTRLDRQVALKLLNADSCRFDTGQIVIEEGKLLARVRHPNVVAVYGAERIDGRIGIWTEFLRGHTLEHLVRERGLFDAREAMQIGIEICRALSAVHGAGLVHRDVKAQNVMREDSGRVVLMDFGTGVELGGEAVRAIAGTPLYLAPEVVRGGGADALSDVYSVGVLLFHLVTAEYPVAAGSSLNDLDNAHRSGARRSLSECRSDLPRQFCNIVDRALSPDPVDRFESAATLEEALAGGLIDVQPIVAKRRHLSPWMALATIAILISIGIAIGAARGRRSANAATPPAETVRAMTEFRPAPSMRKVNAPPMGLRGGAPSFDGRFYVNTDQEENLIVVSLANGESRRLTNTAGPHEVAEFSVISPDGASVAYSWVTSDETYELRLMPVAGGPSRLLLRQADHVVVPVEWARDGHDLLVLLYGDHGVAQLALVGVSDSRLRVVYQFHGVFPQRVSLSNDSRFVVFDAPADERGDLQRDIFIVGTDGSPARPLVAHPANDVNPLWTPDGAHVLFVSDRSGTPDAWRIAVRDGLPEGEPELVARNVGRVAIAGFTESGALYYWLQTGARDVFTESLDRGQPGATRVASRFVGSNIGPAYSRDGRYLAYLSQRALLQNVPGAEVLVIRDLKLGTDHEIVPDLRLQVTSPQWSPDDQRLLLRGTDRQNRTGIFVLQVRDGSVTPGVVVDLAHGSDIRPQFAWWIDGRSIVYNSPAGLVVRDPASGAEFRPFDGTRALKGLRVVQFGISPDGASLAFSAVVEGTDPPARVVDVMTLGGSPRELVRAVDPEQVFFQDWLPKGESVLFTKRRADAPGPHALWRASIYGSPAVETGISIPGFTQANGVKVHADGRTIAYTAGEASWELWVMEHFLPEPVR